ncbi:MAG TPA: hypothetical protein VMU34_02955 [Mycobacterium sp.]|nr:hypothetical protein [Mycobacterium sp.]
MTIRLEKPADLLDDVGHRFDIVCVRSTLQKTSGVESVFELTYDTDGAPRPACVADVMVLYP